MYYSISEASALAGEEQYILRYWEREFEELHPRKNRAGNRVYNDKDLEILLAIRKLLREGNHSIRAAKNIIRERYGLPSAAKKDNSTAENGRNGKPAAKQKSNKAETRETVRRETVTLQRRDVLELCSLLKDMALLIRSL